MTCLNKKKPTQGFDISEKRNNKNNKGGHNILESIIKCPPWQRAFLETYTINDSQAPQWRAWLQ